MVGHITMKVSRPVTPKLSEAAHKCSTQADKVYPEEYRPTDSCILGLQIKQEGGG